MARPKQLSIRYPSGPVVSVFGKFHGAGLVEGLLTVAIEAMETVVIGNNVVHPKEMIIPDQRCVVTDETGTVLYTPRDHFDKLLPEMKQWLNDNPGWPST